MSFIKKQRKIAVRFDSYFDENSINHVARIFREMVRTNRIPEGLANNLSYLKTTALSFESSVYSLSSRIVMLTLPKHNLCDVVIPLSKQACVLANQWASPKVGKITNPLTSITLFHPQYITFQSGKKLKAEHYDDDNLQDAPFLGEDNNVFYFPEAEVYPRQDRLFFSDSRPQNNAWLGPFDPSVGFEEAIEHILCTVERTGYCSIERAIEFFASVLLPYCDNNKHIPYKGYRRLFNHPLDGDNNIFYNAISIHEIIGQSVVSYPPETLDAGELNRFLPKCLKYKSDDCALQLTTAITRVRRYLLTQYPL